MSHDTIINNTKMLIQYVKGLKSVLICFREETFRRYAKQKA